MTPTKLARHPFFYVVWFPPPGWASVVGSNPQGTTSPSFATYKAARAFADTLDPALVPTIVAEVVS